MRASARWHASARTDNNARIRNGELAGGRWNIGFNGSLIPHFQTKALDSPPYIGNLVGTYVRYYNLPPNSVRSNNYIPPSWTPNVESYTTYNYSVTWTGIERLKPGLGVKNLFDTDPPFTAHQNDFAAGAGWEPRIADPRGSAFTLLAEYSF